MPRYTYRCTVCEIVFEISHSIKEEIFDCKFCENSGTLVRVPSAVFIKTTREEKKNKKIGQTTKEFIEISREELKEQKQELIKGRNS